MANIHDVGSNRDDSQENCPPTTVESKSTATLTSQTVGHLTNCHKKKNTQNQSPVILLKLLGEPTGPPDEKSELRVSPPPVSPHEMKPTIRLQERNEELGPVREHQATRLSSVWFVTTGPWRTMDTGEGGRVVIFS